MNRIKQIKSILKYSEYTEQDLKFVNGKAIVKDGRRMVAKVFDRDKYYKINNINSGYSDYPYSIELPNIGHRECESIEECLHFINKYSILKQSDNKNKQSLTDIINRIKLFYKNLPEMNRVNIISDISDVVNRLNQIMRYV